MIGQLFHGQQTGDVLRQQTENLGVMHLAQGVHLPLGIGLEFLEARRQLGTKGRPVWDGIEQAIMDAEADVETWQSKMAHPAIMADAGKMHEACEKFAAAQEKVKTLYGRWDFLDAKLKA